MVNVVVELHVLYLRITQQGAGIETAVQRDIDVLGNRHRDKKTAVVAIVQTEVRSSAADRNPKRTACYDHGGRIPLDSLIRAHAS